MLKRITGLLLVCVLLFSGVQPVWADAEDLKVEVQNLTAASTAEKLEISPAKTITMETTVTLAGTASNPEVVNNYLILAVFVLQRGSKEALIFIRSMRPARGMQSALTYMIYDLASAGLVYASENGGATCTWYPPGVGGLLDSCDWTGRGRK